MCKKEIDYDEEEVSNDIIDFPLAWYLYLISVIKSTRLHFYPD